MFIWKIYTSIFGKTQLIKLALLFFCMVMLTIATSWSVSAWSVQ